MRSWIPWMLGAAAVLPWVGRATESELQRQSPHLPLGATDPAQAGCPACHSTTPATGASVADAMLRAPIDRACTTCHPGDVHVGTVEHLGRRQTAAMASPLPLGPAGTIGCWTCHDVHQPPVPRPVPSELAAVLGPAPVGPVAMLALSDGRLCLACHGDLP